MNLKLSSMYAHKYLYRHTLQDYRNNGILPYRQLGGKILYRESDIERVLQSCYRGKF